MSKEWTHSGAFAHFGASPRNIQWSWSAKSADGKTVVLTLWKDKITRRDGRVLYEWGVLPDQVRRRPGFSELMENLAWARDHCNGRFRVIIAKAKDERADPRSIEECYPVKWAMKLIEFDPIAGTFTAEQEIA
jgi:hypothetical protein